MKRRQRHNTQRRVSVLEACIWRKGHRLSLRALPRCSSCCRAFKQVAHRMLCFSAGTRRGRQQSDCMGWMYGEAVTSQQAPLPSFAVNAPHRHNPEISAASWGSGAVTARHTRFGVGVSHATLLRSSSHLRRSLTRTPIRRQEICVIWGPVPLSISRRKVDSEMLAALATAARGKTAQSGGTSMPTLLVPSSVDYYYR